jgi:hypothetical protein
MGLKFNFNKYTTDNSNALIKAATANRHTLQHINTAAAAAHKKVNSNNIKKKKKNNNNKNKSLTLDNRKFLRLIAKK